MQENKRHCDSTLEPRSMHYDVTTQKISICSHRNAAVAEDETIFSLSTVHKDVHSIATSEARHQHRHYNTASKGIHHTNSYRNDTIHPLKKQKKWRSKNWIAGVYSDITFLVRFGFISFLDSPKLRIYPWSKRGDYPLAIFWAHDMYYSASERAAKAKKLLLFVNFI